MMQALYKDKSLIVNILVHSFADNKSIRYIVKQDSKREERLRKLMAYSFEQCYWFGEVYLTEDKKACALILFPHQKKTSIASIWLDLGLAFSVIGLSNLKKLKRIACLFISKHQPVKISPGMSNLDLLPITSWISDMNCFAYGRTNRYLLH